ncbi:MAG: four helix bundle protein [Verrucomicrobiota bacterium]
MNSTGVKFDHEKLDVYQLELRFVEWLSPFLDEVGSRKGRTREICDQLDRASLSILLNTAEGNGRRQRQTRAKFFDDARGSATECAACLDAAVAKKPSSLTRINEGKILLLRIVSILCKLVQRFESPETLYEQAVECHVSDVKGASRTRTRTTTSTTRALARG